MAAEQRRRGHGRSADDLDRRAAGYEEGAEIIRQLLAQGGAREGSEG
jgi:hypothetical protein